MKLSVIMSVYNAEKYLEKAVNSILNQSFTDFEFIIIEDCSTDNSLKILENFAQKDQRIKLIKKPENKGMKGFIENLNLGLENTQGQYIARMDADDISLPQRFEKQVNYLDEHSEIFMVGSNYRMIDEEDCFIGNSTLLEDCKSIKNQMIKRIAMHHPTIMFRNDSQIRYREKIFYCEDYDLFLRLMNLGKNFYNFTEPLLEYRILKSSISRKDGSFKRTLFVEKIKQFYYETLKKGKDSYEKFISETLLNILDDKQKHQKKDLLFALKVATKYGYKNEFSQLMKIYQQNFSTNFEILVLNLLNKLPIIGAKIYFKIFRL